MATIYKVHCILTPEKFLVEAKELEATETTKTFKVNDSSNWGRQMIRKTELMKPDTGSYRRYLFHTVYYRVYCLEQDVEKAKELVERLVMDDFNMMSITLKTMERRFLASKGRL